MNWLKSKVSTIESKESIIDKGCVFEGTLESTSTVVINGYYIGNTIKAHKVVINKDAMVKTNIFADILVLNGTLIGNVIANARVILEDNANLAGNIESPELICSEGVNFEGNCLISKTKENNNSAESISKRIKHSFQKRIESLNLPPHQPN